MTPIQDNMFMVNSVFQGHKALLNHLRESYGALGQLPTVSNGWLLNPNQFRAVSKHELRSNRECLDIFRLPVQCPPT